MKKIIFLLLFTVFFISCNNSFLSTERIIYYSLPAWPPSQNSSSLPYPELSRWKITISNKTGISSFYINTAPPPLKVSGDSPTSIIATPITKNSNGKETIFFKSAGFIYPFSNNEKLTWEDGFITSILQDLFANSLDKETNLNLINSFNWKKAITIIRNKISNKEDDVSKNYNPWLLNKSTILEKITSGKFSSAYFNIPSSLYVEPEKIPPYFPPVLSSFIPDNKLAPTHYLNYSTYYSSPSTAIIIKPNSSKKLLPQHIFLPIFIEDL